MNQVKIIVAPDHNGHVSPETVKIVAFDPKRRVEVELQTVAGLRLESYVKDGRTKFRAELLVIDPAIDLAIPVEQIDVVGDPNYALKQEGPDELVRALKMDLQSAGQEISRLETSLATEHEERTKAETELAAFMDRCAGLEAELAASKTFEVEKPAVVTETKPKSGAAPAKK
jgi:hypothetical protein